MLKNAVRLSPENILYKWGYYGVVSDPEKKQKRLDYAKQIIKNSAIKKQMLEKGSVGEFVLMLIEGSSRMAA